MDSRMNHERAVELRNTDQWTRICGELDFRISSLIAELRVCSTEDIEIIRTKLKMLEEFKRLPDDVVEREADPD
jgi:hypothetical protein